MNQIIEETVNSLYRDAFKKKISFIHDKKDIHFVNADIGQARIILQNILANALKYAPLNSKIEIFYSEEEEDVRVISFHIFLIYTLNLSFIFLSIRFII